MGVVVDTAIRYAVMIGSNGEYSLCRAERCPPPGWRLEGTEGTRSECMACVQAHAAPAVFAA
ncbi:MAG TPA: MbtH family NRPS accessory protein, partial [Plasticicumulans sp.]|nr:MbtH family NRPS accessory protein [Plasticicumulans sp.]